MPYIKQQRRDELTSYKEPMENPGELNYKLTLLLLDDKLSNTRFIVRALALIERYKDTRTLNYLTINDISGAIFNALMEHTRRMGRPSKFEGSLLGVLRDFYTEIGGPYEDIKKVENGDVYTS